MAADERRRPLLPLTGCFELGRPAFSPDGFELNYAARIAAPPPPPAPMRCGRCGLAASMWPSLRAFRAHCAGCGS